MKKIKKYYRIEFELTSPLAVGCGEDRVSDSDIVRDGRGFPYIPGTALAGVYRRLFTPETAEKYFGPDLTEGRIRESSKKGKNMLTDSSVIVYDAHTLNSEKGVSVTRDMVALDEYKVAKPGAKFDFEVLEPGVTFVTYIEQNMEKPDQQYVADEIAFAWLSGAVKVGAKTARGYGHTKSVRIDSRLFNLSDEADRENWLEFDMYEDTDEKRTPAWESVSTPCCLSSMKKDDAEYKAIEELYEGQEIQLAKKDIRTLCLDMKLLGGISVRKYSTDVGEADYVQLTETGDAQTKGEGIPVIPGTTWAGAFRAQMGRLDSRFKERHDLAELFFGTVKGGDGRGEDKSSKSRVGFSESRLKNGHWVTYTRNAIDRFSGGTVDGALYTERTYYHGETELEITCDLTDVKVAEKERFAKALAAAIMDLHEGYMAVGGLTAVGRGLFEIRSLRSDGREIQLTDKDAEQDFKMIVDMIVGKGE